MLAPVERLRAQRLERVVVLALLVFALLLRLRIGYGWTFAGADSFAYLGAARELAENHRYAFRLPDWYPDHAAPRPLGYCRLPGYPVFLALSAFLPYRGWPALNDYATIFARIKPLQAVLDVVTCLLVFAIARRWAGRRAGFIALALACLFPPLWLFASSILTETLATLLSTAVIALLACELWPNRQPPGRVRHLPWIGAGATLALSALVRIDGLFLLPALGLPVLRYGRRSLRVLPWVLVAFAVVFAPWPLRNQLRLGQPHPLGGQCDVRGDAMQHTSFFAWFATWVTRESQTPQTLYCLLRRECVSTVGTYPPEAFDSAEERAELQRLFALRQQEGLSPRVDEGFRRLAVLRVRAHPLRTLVWLPMQRAFFLWATAIDQPLRATRNLPWPTLTRWLMPALGPLQVCVLLLGLLGLIRGLRQRQTRALAGLAAVCLVSRTAALALIGFVENRYTLELYPLVLVLAGLGLSSASTAAETPLQKAKVDDE
jgi:4-amino-4-deoxy-L-arabinose transferase-like glycosyltransferase